MQGSSEKSHFQITYGKELQVNKREHIKLLQGSAKPILHNFNFWNMIMTVESIYFYNNVYFRINTPINTIARETMKPK